MVIGTRTKAKIPPIAAGMYMAICVGIYDLGEQQTKYDGKTKYVNQVQFVFELPAEQVEVDGEMKPRRCPVHSRSAPQRSPILENS